MARNTINPNFSTPLFTCFFLSTHYYLLVLSQVADPEAADQTRFSYFDGVLSGPDKWGMVDPNWQVCNNGSMQSPVDLLDKRVEVVPTRGLLTRNYRPARAVVKNRGHDITVAWRGNAGTININGTNYNLLQCHWHSPSEHSFNGTRYRMELHVVHANARGEIAVVGIVYKFGRPDPFLAQLLQQTTTIGLREQDLGIFNPRAIRFGSRKYYRYIGSLTVPPCTEGVVWTIIKEVRTVSRWQVRALREAVQDGFESNARPVQLMDGRTVRFYFPTEDEDLL